MDWISEHEPSKIGTECADIVRVPLPVNDVALYLQLYVGPRLKSGRKYFVVNKEEIAQLATQNTGIEYEITDIEFDKVFFMLIDTLNERRKPATFWIYVYHTLDRGGFSLELIQVPL